jgi:hypothetical protein
MLRIYARLLAVVLALIGLAALASILGVGPGAGILYLSSAAIAAYVSFSQRDPDIVRIVVGGMGVLFLLSGLFLALMMSVFGFPYEGRGWEVGLGHAALGALTMSCAVLLPCAEDEQPPPPRGDLFSCSHLCLHSPNVRDEMCSEVRIRDPGQNAPRAGLGFVFVRLGAMALPQRVAAHERCAGPAVR